MPPYLLGKFENRIRFFAIHSNDIIFCFKNQYPVLFFKTFGVMISIFCELLCLRVLFNLLFCRKYQKKLDMSKKWQYNIMNRYFCGYTNI